MIKPNKETRKKIKRETFPCSKGTGMNLFRIITRDPFGHDQSRTVYASSMTEALGQAGDGLICIEHLHPITGEVLGGISMVGGTDQNQ